MSTTLTSDVIDCLVKETNRYSSLYLTLHKEDLKPSADYSAWPTDGINHDKMMLFLALTFFTGIIKEDELRSYWSTDHVLSIPFPRSLMSRRDFF